jgi:outer membrane protein OmpA-like peptidoglycan-associated protein
VADQTVLLPGFTAALDELALELRGQKQLLVTVRVHTDATGSEDFNLQQSQQRAQAIAGYLAEHGVAAGRVRAVGVGESAPLPADNTAEGRDQNRRVDIAISTLSS